MTQAMRSTGALISAFRTVEPAECGLLNRQNEMRRNRLQRATVTQYTRELLRL
jgi:hypothetical protein